MASVKCPICDKEFKTVQNMNRHKSQAHKSEIPDTDILILGVEIPTNIEYNEDHNVFIMASANIPKGYEVKHVFNTQKNHLASSSKGYVTLAKVLLQRVKA